MNPLPEGVNIRVNVFTYARKVESDVLAWCCGVGPSLKDHPRVKGLNVSCSFGYPTDRCRNGVAKKCKDEGVDFLLMIDDDMAPDLMLRKDPNAVPFLPTALDFMLNRDGPCVVAAPYCSGPPDQEVLVMKYREEHPDLPDGRGVRLSKFTRDEAAILNGIQRVAALPTGCMMIDLRCLDILPPPWFAYEYADPPYNTELASSEDIVFSRNLDWLGVPQFCHWSAWAGHNKDYRVGKPVVSPIPSLPQAVYKAWESGWRPPVRP